MLPVARPFLLYRFSPDGDKTLIFWIQAFQSAALPILTLALFDYSSQVFAMQRRLWRNNPSLYVEFPKQVTGILSISSVFVIWGFAPISLQNALLGAAWCFLSIVFLGQLKIVRLTSVTTYYQCILIKVFIEFSLYLLLIKLNHINILYQVFIVVDASACLITTILINRKFIKKRCSVSSSLKDRLSVVRTSVILIISLSLAGLCFQLDRLVLINILPSTEYELYLTGAIFKGVAMSFGAVLASFLFPYLALHVRKPTKQSVKTIRLILIGFYFLFPFILLVIGFGLWIITQYIFPISEGTSYTLLSISIIITLCMNILPESYLFVVGRNRKILSSAILGIVLQLLFFYLLRLNEIFDYSAYLWAVAITLFIQVGYLSLQALASLKNLSLSYPS